ncbi:MAG: hypothetical protein Q4E63_05330 [Prevotellaceae bacterium]|nr:hypothetical protein [Prevotellaceae bacterium]MDO4932060.1 hypothetical protein [Prevotellaceae bacterium]
MKHFIILLLACTLFPLTIQAQDITGKWKCRKGALEQLGSHYKYLKGNCRFKDDGTFEVRLNSTMEVPSQYSVYIRLKGTYTMANGLISTHIDIDGVYCNVPNDTHNPYIKPKQRLNEGHNWAENWDERKYDVSNSVKDLQEDSREAELVREWNWKNEQVTLSGKTLSIGNKAKLRK